jgi:hypothetical protein
MRLRNGMSSTQQLYDKARSLDVDIQHDCGGYRIVKGGRSLFPEGGICPTATRRDCMIWLTGFWWGRKEET